MGILRDIGEFIGGLVSGLRREVARVDVGEAIPQVPQVKREHRFESNTGRCEWCLQLRGYADAECPRMRPA